MKEIENVLETITKPTVERNLISICLKNPNALVLLKEKDIVPEMFLIEANRYIFMAMNYLYSKGQDLTPYAIMEVMQNNHMKDVVNAFGGDKYLMVLTQQMSSIGNVDIFCDKLKQAYTRYKLYKVCIETERKLLTDEVEVLNPTEIISDHESKVTELSTEIQTKSEIYKIGDTIEEIINSRMSHPDVVPGLEVGMKKFDYLTNGGQPGDLFMVCARAKTGKSTILTNWAVKLGIKDKIPVLYFDTEMSSKEQEDRILSMLSGVPHKEVVSGLFAIDTENGTAKEKMAKIKAAVKEMREGEYYHIYLPNFTIEKVQTIARQYKMQHNIQAVFFDYLKFPASQLNNMKNAEWQALGYIASGLKDMAGLLEIPVYSACQENRSNLDGPKDERNVGGSDRILQLASKLMFLSNKSEETMLKERGEFGNQELYIAFQRNGESNCPPINIRFDKETCTQTEV